MLTDTLTVIYIYIFAHLEVQCTHRDSSFQREQYACGRVNLRVDELHGREGKLRRMSAVHGSVAVRAEPPAHPAINTYVVFDDTKQTQSKQKLTRYSC